MTSSDNKIKENEENYFKIREEVTKAKLSNSVTQDKAIFALSSAFLGFSITLISNQASSEIQIFFWIVASSWVLFGMAIITTLLSFRVSQKAQDENLKIADAYYLNGDLKAIDKSNKPADILYYLNWASLIIFCFGVVFTILFAIINFTNNGDMKMAEEQNNKKSVTVKLVDKSGSTDFGVPPTQIMAVGTPKKNNVPKVIKKGADVTPIPKPLKEIGPNNTQK